MAHIVNRKGRRRIVVDYRAGPICIANRRAACIAQVDRKRFVGLKGGIASNQYRDLFACLVGCEGERSATGLIIAVRNRSCSIERLEIHGRAYFRGASLRYGEDIGSGSSVTFVVRHIINREAWYAVIIYDCSSTICVADRCAAHIG